MADLQKRLKKIISEIEQNLSNKDDLEYVKTQIYNIYTMFLDEFEKLESKCNEKVENILIKCKVLDDRMNEIENSIDKIENDIYIKENEEYDFDITCPYCDTEFSIDYSNTTSERVICPECNHTIELDWNEHEDGCSHECYDCDGHCDHHEDDDEDM